jgi:hypothetical protein
MFTHLSRLLPSSLRRSFAAAACSLALAPVALAQKYQTTFGDADVVERGLAMTKVPQGYVIAGTDGTNMTGVLTNPNGGWLIGVDCPTLFPGVKLTPNCVRRSVAGGVIVAGEVEGWTGGVEVYLSHYTPNGALWPTGVLPGRTLIYKGDRTGERQGVRVVERTGGGYAVTTNIDPGTMSQGVLFTTFANGLLKTWTSYSSFDPVGVQPVRFHDLRQASNGDFVIVGSVRDPFGLRRTLVVRTSSVGAVIWALQFSNVGVGPGEDVEHHAITETANGNFAVWGHYSTTSPTPGSFLFEINGFGGGLWRREFPTIEGSRPTIDRVVNWDTLHPLHGSLVMNGRVGDDGLILRTDANGNAPMARTYGIAGSVDELFQVLAIPDGSYVASGSTQIGDPGFNEFYLVRADANGDSTCNWQPFPVAPTSPWPYHTQVYLSETQGGQMHYLYMAPMVPALPEHPQCFTPGPAISIGTAAATTVSMPSIWPVRPPVIGDPNWGLEIAGLVPNGVGVVALSLALSPMPFPLQLIGGQPGAMVYGDMNMMGFFTVLGDAEGSAFLPFPLPPNPALVGADMNWQVFPVDPALPFALPVGSSQAIGLTIQ